MLCHRVECATILEPLELTCVEGVRELTIPLLTVLWMHDHG